MLERRWDAARPLPRRWVFPDGVVAPAIAPDHRPIDFTGRMTRLCADVAARCPAFAHIDVGSLLVSVTPARNRSVYGLQARVTPMRFRAGRPTRRFRGAEYQVQRYFVDGREVMYLVTFCLPRFLDLPFGEKLVTVFHELYHIGPAFDGDLRRHAGRCTFHTHSKKAYDARMAGLVRAYLAGHPDPGIFDFLRHRTAHLWQAHGGITGVVVPRPKMVPSSGQWSVASGQ